MHSIVFEIIKQVCIVFPPRNAKRTSMKKEHSKSLDNFPVRSVES